MEITMRMVVLLPLASIRLNNPHIPEDRQGHMQKVVRVIYQ